MVNDGVATTGELDESIVYGPGLRWAAMGTNLIYHLAGGETGMRHMLRQFGPCLKWPWTRLEAPELTEELIDRMVEGTQAQAAGRSIREIERLRDDYLVAIQQVLKQFNIGAGATLRAVEARLYEENAKAAREAVGAVVSGGGVDAAKARGAGGGTADGAAAGKASGADGVAGGAAAGKASGTASGTASGSTAGGLRLLETYVRPEWVDYNGHMTDSRYLQVFGDATDALWRSVGVDDSYRASGRALYTVESHVTHSAEAKPLEPLYVLTRLLNVDDKRVHVFNALYRTRDDVLVATGEQMYLHVDTKAGKATSMDPAVREKLGRIRTTQSGLTSPAQAGRHIGMPRD
jgi:carnitine 3-dehydrogenase